MSPDLNLDRTGGCLCEGVRYTASLVRTEILQCHCANCRRLTGSHVEAIRAHSETLELTDRADYLKWHDLEYAQYGFCTNCGSTLFYRAADRLQFTGVMVGTLDDASGLSIGQVWYADEAPAHATLPPGVPLHAGNGSATMGSTSGS